MDTKSAFVGEAAGSVMQPRRQSTWRRQAFVFAAALLALLFWSRAALEPFLFAAQNPGRREPSKHVTAFNQITPHKDIVWHPCYENFTCARLSVPLDWQDPSDELRAYIAVIKYPAKPEAHYRGPVFINPGGPGGSGVWFVTHLAQHYQKVVGDGHDIISFDPRGIGNTWPLADCWADEQNRRVWELMQSRIGTVDSHEGVLSDAFANAKAVSLQCEKTMGGGPAAGADAGSDEERRVREAGIARFMSTADAARDMLRIAEKLGERKLKYWGFSYGTVLGTTFAAMFPDRIERMVNDGNVDANDWYRGAGFKFIEDADKVMYAFYHFCSLAGPKHCPFHAPSPGEIRVKLQKVLQDTKKEPVVFMPNSTHEHPSFITYSDIRRQIQSAIYQPLLTFPKLALALSSLEAGDPQPFLALKGAAPLPLRCDEPTLPPGKEVEPAEDTQDATAAVLCGEVSSLPNDLDEFQLYVDELTSLSEAAGVTAAEMWLRCVGWKIKAKSRFEGHVGGNTSFPILFVANAADNVTPLSSAVTNSKNFPGSVVLVQDAFGHTTLSTPSRCTARTIRAYFQTGKLPDEGTVCEADAMPFGVKKDVRSREALGDEDAELDAALHALMLAPVVSMGR